MRALLIPAAVASLACGCGGGLWSIEPEIDVDACAAPAPLRTDDCVLDFGAGAVGQPEQRALGVTNPETVPLDIEPQLVGDPAFTLAPDAFVVGAGASNRLIVTVRPTSVGTIRATLFLRSDATNGPRDDEGRSLVTVALTAQGVDDGTPKLVVPAACSFGDVPVSTTARCDLAVENDGERDLIVDAVDVVPAPGAAGGEAAAPFTVPALPQGAVISPGASVVLAVAFSPELAGAAAATLRIESNDPGGSVDVALTGTGI